MVWVTRRPSRGRGRVPARKCHAALDDGGTLVVAEAFVDDDGSGPRAAALMSLHMLVNTAGGRNYSRAAYERMLLRAGFAGTERVPVAGGFAAGVNGLLVARRGPVAGA
ncbi:methyltransferase [Streptomyces sp. 71268]|nr:methyltransferase [Streptomyces sp. 71268]WEV29725.1 methyltransferase [Streptomyces sp. 71268]